MSLLSINKKAEIIIAIIPDGLPRITALIPAPFISEIERQKRIDDAIKGIWIDGYFIESQNRIKNDIFDKKSEKTTTQIVYRACKNKDEAEFILLKVIELMGIPKENTKISEVNNEFNKK
jgi:hypothetical protein